MAKTATFGVMHLVTSFAVTYTLTGSVTIAGLVTFIEPLVNTVMHYFFDKHWDHPSVLRLRRHVARALATMRARTLLRPMPPRRSSVAAMPLVPAAVDHFSTNARSIT